MIDALFFSWVLLCRGRDGCCKGIGLKNSLGGGNQDVGLERRELDASRSVKREGRSWEV